MSDPSLLAYVASTEISCAGPLYTTIFYSFIINGHTNIIEPENNKFYYLRPCQPVFIFLPEGYSCVDPLLSID